MLVAATKAVAAKAPCNATDPPDASKGLLPDVADVREVSVGIALAVVKTAVEEGIATESGIPDAGDGDEVLEEWIREQMWEARYRPLRRVEAATADKLAKGQAGMSGGGGVGDGSDE